METSGEKYLGIDWGEQRIGLAVGSWEIGLAVPYGVALSFSEVLAAIIETEVDALIVGQPLKLSGVFYPNSVYNDFLERLRREAGRPVYLIDERLSSRAADRLPGQKSDKAPRDAIAAMLILQAWLDRERSNQA